MCGIVQEAMSKCHNIGIFDLQYSAAFLQQSWRMSEQSYLINPIIDHIMSLTVFLSFSFTKQNKTYKTRDTHGSRNRNSTELLPGRSLPEGRSSATSSNHTLNHQKKHFDTWNSGMVHSFQKSKQHEINNPCSLENSPFSTPLSSALRPLRTTACHGFQFPLWS